MASGGGPGTHTRHSPPTVDLALEGFSGFVHLVRTHDKVWRVSPCLL